jgi:phage replication-related protein YjqB (UPF0714/DUF867 family)
MPKDQYDDFNALAKHQREGVDFAVTMVLRPSPIAVIAPHGGGIEPGTSEVARTIAARDYNLYCFEGLKRSDNPVLHITSTRFNEPRCLTLIAGARYVLSIHGCEETRSAIWVGGRDSQLATRVRAAIENAGIETLSDQNGAYAGVQPTNVCNRGLARQGCQLELSLGLRRTLFVGLEKRHGRREQTPQLNKLARAIREVLGQISRGEDPATIAALSTAESPG